MENEDKEILNIEKGKQVVDTLKISPKKKSLLKRFELYIYIIAIFILISFFFLAHYPIQNQSSQIKMN